MMAKLMQRTTSLGQQPHLQRQQRMLHPAPRTHKLGRLTLEQTVSRHPPVQHPTMTDLEAHEAQDTN